MSTNFTFDESVHLLEQSLVERLKDTKTIHVWQESERIPDKEIGINYPINYFARVTFKHQDRDRAQSLSKVHALIRKGYPHPNLANLPNSKIKELNSWSRDSAEAIRVYLANRFGVFLKSIDIFFLPNGGKKNFIVPNIYVRNLSISKDYRGKNLISTEDFISSWIEDLEHAITFRNAISQFQKC